MLEALKVNVEDVYGPSAVMPVTNTEPFSSVCSCVMKEAKDSKFSNVPLTACPMVYTVFELVWSGMIRGSEPRPSTLTVCAPTWMSARGPMRLLVPATFTSISELLKTANGATVPLLQSITSWALIVVTSSSVEASKFGGAAAESGDQAGDLDGRAHGRIGQVQGAGAT